MKTEIKPKIVAVLKAFIQPDCINHWICVKDRSLGNIIRQEGLAATIYTTAILNKLKSIGLVEVENKGMAMRYCIKSDIIYDIDSLAEDIVSDLRNKWNEKRSKEWFETREGDTKPYRPKKQKSLYAQDINECKQSKKTFVQIPRLGEVGYVIADNGKNVGIVQCRVVGLNYNNEYRHILLTLLTSIKSDNNDSPSMVLNDYPLKQFFYSVEDILCYLKNNVFKL